MNSNEKKKTFNLPSRAFPSLTFVLCTLSISLPKKKPPSNSHLSLAMPSLSRCSLTNTSRKIQAKRTSPSVAATVRWSLKLPYFASLFQVCTDFFRFRVLKSSRRFSLLSIFFLSFYWFCSPYLCSVDLGFRFDAQWSNGGSFQKCFWMLRNGSPHLMLDLKR